MIKPSSTSVSGLPKLHLKQKKFWGIFSTWQTIDTDAQRANKRAKDILETLSAGKVHTKLRLKAIEGDYIFENEDEPVRARQKRELVVLGEGTRPDLLVGANSRFYNVASPFPTVVYAFFESREPNLNELPPMRVGMK